MTPSAAIPNLAPFPHESQSPTPFSLKVLDAGRATLVTVHGPLDVESAPRLLSNLSSRSAATRRLVLDLHEADYVDSAGVRALISLQQQHSDPGHELRLVVRPASRVERVLRLLRLEGEFHVYAHVSEAWHHRDEHDA